MTATSFHALRHTLEDRLAAMQSGNPPRLQQPDDEADAEPTDPEGEVLAPDEVAVLERQALAQEEQDDIARLLEDIRKLPPDTKSGCLCEELDKLRAADYTQTMVFTMYTDTMDFLREELTAKTTLRVMCFSGRGGEVHEKDGHWRTISRDEAKRRFRAGQADVLLCTDAAAEGLNFQFCGSLINYDMPWNPMRVEQRIVRPGMAKPVRITTRPDYFDDHTESLELWSPGSPSFPAAEAEATSEELDGNTIAAILSSAAPKENSPS